MAIEFSSILKQAEGMKATGGPIPDSVVVELGRAKTATPCAAPSLAR